METSLNKLSGAILLTAAAGTCLASAARAENPLGFYLGLGLGESTVRSDNVYGFDSYYPYDGYYNSPNHHFAWKAIAGIRPVSIVGAEIEYIDFGHPGSDNNYNYYNQYNYGPDSHPRAIAAFGVGHIPLPLPFLDIYGKAGAARLHTIVNGFDGPPTCPLYAPCPSGSPFSQSRWDTRFAYGAGVQYRFWGLSARAEYERISSPYGDPDMVSVSATWTF
jgi:opacity protein-like surface antigen